MSKNSYNTKVPVPAGKVPAETLDKANTKDAPGAAGDRLGGKIAGFGSGSPDASTVNGNSARSAANFGSVSGSLGKTASNPDDKKITGFTDGGIKPGKV
jgi:hypothetical protein